MLEMRGGRRDTSGVGRRVRDIKGRGRREWAKENG